MREDKAGSRRHGLSLLTRIAAPHGVPDVTNSQENTPPPASNAQIS
jgi:hypothetical protein